jgi:hypothetical protein
VLYRVVRDHLETFLQHARDTYDAPLPHYVEQELRGYLRCGVFAHGFVHARCETCGHDLLVAFSCKGRGVCPSCAGRRMANTAAHLVDRVLPSVPVRQWVLSLPFDLRGLAAFRADVLSALSRIFVESIFTRYRASARRAGLDGAECGAVTFVQRFGSSLNLHVHFHVVVLDGVLIRDEHGQARFHPAAAPHHGELLAVAERVHRRAAAWLARRAASLTDSESAAEPLRACAATAMQRGTLAPLPSPPQAELDQVPEDPPSEVHDSVDAGGFNLEAGVRIEADDDLGRERLCRYGARPALAIGRLRMIPGGRIAYRIKKLRGGRAKTRIMTPLELLARLSALVPPPRYPLVRYHGVLAPRSSWRRDVVPKPSRPIDAPAACTAAAAPSKPRASPVHQERERADKPRRERTEPRDPPAPNHERSAPAPSDSSVALVAPNILSLSHWNRILCGRLLAAAPRIDWATLLRRTFDVDVLECAVCHGRLRVIAEVTDAVIVRGVLDTLGISSEPPRPARARDPTELFGDTTDED